MKLPIKKKFFDKIKNGEKDAEFRDSHITFVCKETGETLRVDVESVRIEHKNKVRDLLGNPPEFDEMFKDDKQIMFKIRNGKRT